MTDRPPKEAYTDTVWLKHEQRTLFENAWVAAATVHDFKERGDYRTVSCGKARIAVVRDTHGKLRAFHDICRHRGILWGRFVPHAGHHVDTREQGPNRRLSGSPVGMAGMLLGV